MLLDVIVKDVTLRLQAVLGSSDQHKCKVAGFCFLRNSLEYSGVSQLLSPFYQQKSSAPEKIKQKDNSTPEVLWSFRESKSN